MYTNDLKQFVDYLCITDINTLVSPNINEHDALSDAKWNFQLYQALTKNYGIKI